MKMTFINPSVSGVHWKLGNFDLHIPGHATVSPEVPDALVEKVRAHLKKYHPVVKEIKVEQAAEVVEAPAAPVVAEESLPAAAASDLNQDATPVNEPTQPEAENTAVADEVDANVEETGGEDESAEVDAPESPEVAQSEGSQQDTPNPPSEVKPTAPEETKAKKGKKFFKMGRSKT